METNTLTQPVLTIPGQLPPDVVEALNSKAKQLGIHYASLEKEYLAYVTRPDIAKKTPVEQKHLGMLMMGAIMSRLAENPLETYEFVVLGTTLNTGFNTSKIICGSMIPGKDVPTLFNCESSLGIPTIISNFKETFGIVKTMTPLSFFRANLTSSGIGVQRREITSTVDSIFEPIPHSDIPREKMMGYIEKTYPVKQLADLMIVPSKLVQPKKAGKNPFVDDLDFSRVQVAIKNTNVGSGDNGTYYQYTVVDESLTDSQKQNKKDAAGKVTVYGGVKMNIPEHIYTQLNLDVNSVIDALVTARKINIEPGKESTSTTGISLNAMAVFPIPGMDFKKKTPDVQIQAGHSSSPQIQSVDLTTMG